MNCSLLYSQHGQVKPLFVVLADFLCQLSLINETIATRRPSLISASALLLSLEILAAPAALSAVLLEDCGLAFDLSEPGAVAELARCCMDMRTEWCQPIDPSSAQVILSKFVSSLGMIAAWSDPGSIQLPAILAGAKHREAVNTCTVLAKNSGYAIALGLSRGVFSGFTVPPAPPRP